MINPTLEKRINDLIIFCQGAVNNIGDENSSIHVKLTQLELVLRGVSKSVNHYKPIHFGITELVYEQLYTEFANKDLLWNLFDPRALWTLDALRIKFGVAYVNTWYGELQYVYDIIFNMSGLRPAHVNVGAKYSQHKYGRAFDVKFSAVSAAEILEDMVNNPTEETYKYITVVERTQSGKVPTWLHFDVRNISTEGIHFIDC